MSEIMQLLLNKFKHNFKGLFNPFWNLRISKSKTTLVMYIGDYFLLGKKCLNQNNSTTNVSKNKKLLPRSIIVLLMIGYGNLALAQVCGFTTNTDAKYRNQVWWSGYTSNGDEWTLDFSSSTAVLTNAATGQTLAREGTATYTSLTGDLLLYTDGSAIWNGQTHTQIATNINLNGSALSSIQASAIVPMPGGDPENDFYVFWNNNNNSEFGVIEVDLAAGSAVANRIINANVDERMMVIPHGNFTDYWVVVTDFSTTPDTYYVYEVNSSGISLSSTQQLAGFDLWLPMGTIVFSPVTNKLAITSYQNSIWVADFDVDTGIISNPEVRIGNAGVTNRDLGYSVTFSPNGSRLYTSIGRDIAPGSTLVVPSRGVPSYHDLTGPVNNRTLIAGAPSIYAGTSLAYDGKIYFANNSINTASNRFIGVISNPDGVPSYSTQSLGTKLSGLNFPNSNFAACNHFLSSTCLSYDVIEPYDISEAIHSGVQLDLGSDVPVEIEFNTNGTKLFVLSSSPARTIKEYYLRNPWDVSTAVYSGNSIGNLTGGVSIFGFKFVPGGRRFFLTEGNTDKVYQYDLLTPWDITSASLTSDAVLSETNPFDVVFNNDGHKMYIAGLSQHISEYDLAIPYTLAGATFVQNITTSPIHNIPLVVEFSNDGQMMFITGSANIEPNQNKVSRYNLSTPWDISSAIFDTSYSVATQHNRPSGLVFSPNGKYFYVTGSIGVDPGINEITRYEIGFSSFTEAVPEDLGMLSTGEALTISIENDTFSNAGGILTPGADYTITNLPAGITSQLAVAVDGKSASLTLSGIAIDHFAADSVADLTFTWFDSAFTSTLAANLCTGSGPTSSNVGIMFNNGTDYGDARDVYGNGGHGSVANQDLYLGPTAADGDPKFNLLAGDATSDDNDGVDDEDPLVFNLYKDQGGMTCTGSDGTYTTAAKEYCVVVTATNNTTSPAQVVGWLDHGDGMSGHTPNGVFDKKERSTTTPAGSNSSFVDDGTLATGNLPAGSINRNVILVFSGLGQGLAQSRNNTYLRIRVSSDAVLFNGTSAVPTGDAADGEIEDQPIALGTLPVLLNYIESKRDGKLLRLNWHTASEMFNVGFTLWGRGGSITKWQRLNRNLHLVPGGNAAEPRRYQKVISLSNDLSRIDELLVSSMDVDGKEHYFGPFEIGRKYGNGEQLKPINWSSIQAQMDKRMVAMGYEKTKYGRYINVLNVDSDEQQGYRDVIEFAVEQDGLYQIKASDLPKAWQSIAVEELAIIDSKGKAVARHGMSVRPNLRRGGRLHHRRRGAIGSDGWLIFYGYANQGDAKLYSDAQHYRLIHDKRYVRTVKMQRRTGISEGFSEYYRDKQIIEHDNRYLSASTADDPWVSKVVTVTMRRSKRVSESFNVVDAQLDKPLDIIISAGRITGMRAVDSDSDGVQDDEYEMSGLVYNDGEALILDKRGAVGRGLWTERFRLAGGILKALNSDALEVGAQFSVGSGYRINQTGLDYIGIDYARDYRAKPNERYLHFASREEDRALGYEVEVPRDRRIRAYAAWGNNLTLLRPERGSRYDRVNQSIHYRFARLNGSQSKALTQGSQINYWVGGDSGYLKVARLQQKQSKSQASLLAAAQGANYLLVAHPSFLGTDASGRNAVSEFAQFKRGQGHTVSVANYLDIVNAFANGQPGPAGLKSYLSKLAKQGTLQYVLLVGGGSYDYKDILGKGSITTIPSNYRPTDYFSNYTSTDVEYVRDEVDGSLFASIGRWPVRQIEEVSKMVDKHLVWDRRQRESDKAILVAENTDKRNGINFARSMAGLNRWVTKHMDSEPIYVSEIQAESEGSLTAIAAAQQARRQFIDSLNANPQLVMFNGHASSSALSKPVLFSAHDAAKINGGASMWMPLACYVTFYESVEVNTLAHQLLFNGPALSISGATSYSDQNMNQRMAQGILGGMLDNGRSLGEATVKIHTDSGDHRTSQVNWATLGDPSIKY